MDSVKLGLFYITVFFQQNRIESESREESKPDKETKKSVEKMERTERKRLPHRISFMKKLVV